MRSCFQLFIVLIMLPISLLSQNVNNTWYFGNQAGLSFTTNPPTALTGPLQAIEGSATISDPAGNLLFYTNGMTIWDRNHNIMPNGNGISGGVSSTQAALIVPLPGSCSKYYLFTTDDHNGTGCLRYSIVNMCLHNGFGDLETLTKNTLLTLPVGEKITSVKHSNGTDIWIITHKLSSNQFLAFLLTPAGLNNSPVISTLGSVHHGGANIGPIKTSHNGLKLVTSASFANICEMFDFNPTNGQVSNFVNLTQQYSLPLGVYGIEFSPNDSLLYISTFWGINYLFQLNLYTSVKTPLSSISGNYTFGALQIGENQKIYIARGNQNFLSVLNNPNLP